MKNGLYHYKKGFPQGYENFAPSGIVDLIFSNHANERLDERCMDWDDCLDTDYCTLFEIEVVDGKPFKFGFECWYDDTRKISFALIPARKPGYWFVKTIFVFIPHLEGNINLSKYDKP